MFKKKEHTLWVETYRPDSLENYICDDELRSFISSAIEKNDFQNLILHGKTGTGKTTASKIIINNVKCDAIYINGSDENGIDTVREKIKTFVSTASFKPLKVVVLDDCQNFTVQAQQALLNIIETYSKTTRFIFTCNAIGKMIDALQGRCKVMKVVPPDKAGVAGYLANILDKEEVTYEVDPLVTLVNKYFPNVRKCVITLQEASKSGTLELSTEDNVSTDYIDDIISLLKSRKDAFNGIRKIVNDNGLYDFTDVYRALYDRTAEFSKTPGEVCLYLAEGEYESNFVPDREITFMKVIHNLIQLK